MADGDSFGRIRLRATDHWYWFHHGGLPDTKLPCYPPTCIENTGDVGVLKET